MTAPTLSSDVRELKTAVVALTRRSKVNRGAWMALAVLTAVLAGALIWLGTVASTAKQNQHAQRAACQVGNQRAVDSAKLWNHFLDIATPPHPTNEQTKAVADLRASIAAAYHQRKC